MQVKQIPANTLNATCTLLQPFVRDLTPTALVGALRQHADDSTTRNLPSLIDKHAAAKLLGVSWFTVVKMCKDGELPGRKIRGQWRIPADAIRQMMEG